MSATRTGGTAARFFSPLAYVALLMAASVAALLKVRTLESTFGHNVPVSLYVFAELLVAGVVLYIGGRGLLRLEGLRRPGIVDHLRRCALPHTLFVPLSVSLFLLVDLSDPGGGGSFAMMLSVAAGYAIIVDALLLFVVMRRSRRSISGMYL